MIGRIAARLGLACLLLVTLTACGHGMANLPPLAAAEIDNASYKLGPGDKLSLIVFGVKDLSGEVEVGAEGTIALPLIDNVKAVGLTVPQLKEAVESTLKAGYVRDPKVTLQITKYRPIFVSGEVKTPGGYPFVPGMTVDKAVIFAGGFSPRAYRDGFVVTRSGLQYQATETSKLLPDDIVEIAERYF